MYFITDMICLATYVSFTRDWGIVHYKRGSRKFCQRGSNTDNVFFLVDGMERVEMPLKMGHNRPASETTLKWRFAGVPIIAQHGMLGRYRCDFSEDLDQNC